MTKRKVFLSRARFGKIDLEEKLGLQQRTAMLGLCDIKFLWDIEMPAYSCWSKYPSLLTLLAQAHALKKGKDCFKCELQTGRSVTPSFVTASTSFCSQSLDKNKFKSFALIVGVSSLALNLITSEL